MAKQVSKLGDFIGTLDGITYYMLNGVRVCRKATPHTKEQIYNDPRFAEVRLINNEFGGASTYAKAIRTGLEPYLNTFKDHSFNGRLTSKCLQITKKGRGVPGQRNIHVLQHPEALIGIQLNTKYAFKDLLKFSPNLKQKRKGIYISFSGLKKEQFVGKPTYASHFVLIALRNSIPEYSWDPIAKKYTPVTLLPEAGSTCLTSPPIAISEIPEEIEFFLPFLKNPLHKEDQTTDASAGTVFKKAHTIWLGIQFGQRINNRFDPFETGRTMQCIAVC